jgi:hypothetical protein
VWRVYALFVLAWVVLLPPFFTDGACTAQFDAESDRLKSDTARVRTVEAAVRYWSSRSLPVATLTVDECRQAKPRFLSRCGSGTLVFVRVPVGNQVCRIYRDGEIKVQLQYDEYGRLAQMATDMNPFKSFPIPFTSMALHWAR